MRGRGRLVPTVFVPTTERTNRRFPLILTTGRILTQYNVGAQTRRTANSTWHPEDVLEIHPSDAELRGIRSGDTVELSSRVGATALTALVSDRMQPGVVYTTFHHPVTGANVVTTENSDWATNCPEYKVTAVQVGVANARAEGHAEADADVGAAAADAGPVLMPHGPCPAHTNRPLTPATGPMNGRPSTDCGRAHIRLPTISASATAGRKATARRRRSGSTVAGSGLD